MNEPLIDCHAAFAALAALWDGGRFPHSLIVEGAPGSGKRTLAREAIALLLCRAAGSSRELPCGVCTSCHKTQRGLHPDLTTLSPESKKQSIGVDAVRLVRENASISPHEAARRIFFIPEAQNLTTAAQNALLKLIEEPPDTAFFLFTTPSRSNLLETVCSRSAILTLRELPPPRRQAVLQALRPEQELSLLARLAWEYPTVGQALDALENPDVRRREADSQALLEHTLHCERYELMRIFSVWERDREGFLKLLDSFRARCIAALSTGGLSALQCGDIVAIIEETRLSATQNVGLALLCTTAAYKLMRTRTH